MVYCFSGKCRIAYMQNQLVVHAVLPDKKAREPDMSINTHGINLLGQVCHRYCCQFACYLAPATSFHLHGLVAELEFGNHDASGRIAWCSKLDNFSADDDLVAIQCGSRFRMQIELARKQLQDCLRKERQKHWRLTGWQIDPLQWHVQACCRLLAPGEKVR